MDLAAWRGETKELHIDARLAVVSGCGCGCSCIAMISLCGAIGIRNATHDRSHDGPWTLLRLHRPVALSCVCTDRRLTSP